MKLVLLGPPGAGKGTHAKKLMDKYKIPHISTGDIFRANIGNGTELGRKAKAFIDAGALVPDSLTVDLVLDRLHEDDCTKGYILDGFPRTVNQAKALTEALKAQGEKLDYAICLQVEDSVIYGRMSGRRVCSKCGASYHVVNNPTKVPGICDRCGGPVTQRADDAEETVKKRLKVYHEQTAPIIQYYEELGQALIINADRSLDEIFAEMVKVLGE